MRAGSPVLKGDLNFLGATLIAAIVKGAGFPSLGNSLERSKDRSESAIGKERIEDRQTRTLEQHKDAAPEIQNRSKAGPPTHQFLGGGIRAFSGIAVASHNFLKSP